MARGREEEGKVRLRGYVGERGKLENYKGEKNAMKKDGEETSITVKGVNKATAVFESYQWEKNEIKGRL